jgi:hypothetical protein
MYQHFSVPFPYPLHLRPANFVLPPRSGGAVVGCRLGVVSQMVCKKSKETIG